MRQYHLEHEVIPEYINALEDAQKMVALSNARNTIADGTLMLIASTSIHKPQRFPRANDKWDDLAKGSQTWSTLKVLYKDAHSKARINKIAPKGQDQFGAANEAGAGVPPGTTNCNTKPHLAAEDELNTGGGMSDMEGFFDNFAAAATNDKAFLSQLTDNNTKLVNTNEELSASVKKLTSENRQLQQEINTLRRRVGGNMGDNTTNNARGSGSSRRCPNCKREVYHAPDDCYELEKNASLRPAGWRSGL